MEAVADDEVASDAGSWTAASATRERSVRGTSLQRDPFDDAAGAYGADTDMPRANNSPDDDVKGHAGAASAASVPSAKHTIARGTSTSSYQRWDVFVPAVGRVTCEALQGEGRIPLERSFASLHVIPPAVIPKTRLDLIDYQCAPKRNPKSTDD